MGLQRNNLLAALRSNDQFWRKYCQQLDNLKIAIQEKRPILVNRFSAFYRDNAKSLQNRSRPN